MDNDIENSQALSTTTIPIHPDEAWQKRDEANKKKTTPGKLYTTADNNNKNEAEKQTKTHGQSMTLPSIAHRVDLIN